MNQPTSSPRLEPLAVPTVQSNEVAWISEEDMVEVDRVMMEDLRIGLIQMMENAGRQLARLVLDAGSPSTVAVLAGSGGNGGGGLVAARHLANAGVEVVVTTTRPRTEMATVPAHQLDILERMGVEQRAEMPDVDIIIDALIGYSLREAPRSVAAKLIQQSGRRGTVISLDVPSGLDVTSGATPGVVVHADATMTLALPKVGLREAPEVGELYLADISVPPSITAAYGAPPPFGSSGLLLIDRGL